MAGSAVPTAEQVIATLRAHAAELRQAGIRHATSAYSARWREATPVRTVISIWSWS